MAKQLSCRDRIDSNWRGRLKDLTRFMKAYQGEYEPESEDAPDADDVIQEFHEYGLDFAYVPKGTFKNQDRPYWCYQLSWGGPSDEIRFYSRDGSNLDRAEYWFFDWFDGAFIGVSNYKPVQWLWDYFVETGLVESTQEDAERR